MNYGTYVSSEGKEILFDKCDISRMITVTVVAADGESSFWILSLEDFLPFMSIPNFRDLNERKVNLYSTCVFWLLDNTYAQNILYNFSNYSIDDVQDFLKEVPTSDLFPCTNISRDEVFTKLKSDSERKEETTTFENDVGLWGS